MNAKTSTGQNTWTAVDDYFTAQLVQPDPILDQALEDSTAAGLPPHNVAPNQGKFLQLLALLMGAKRILEIGTLGAYSTIWLGRTLPPDGRLITLEADPLHAQVAEGNIARAGLSGIVDLRLGSALDSLAALVDEGVEPFDFIFIDADKPNNPHYLEWSLKLSRPGTVIIGDNVVRAGAVADPNSDDAKVIGVRRFFDLMAAHSQLSATAIQTVGSKGYDGFSIARVEG